jgi:hypothetical protein
LVFLYGAKLTSLVKNRERLQEVTLNLQRRKGEATTEFAKRQLEALEFSFDNDNWKAFCKARRFRNHIVHGGYRIWFVPSDMNNGRASEGRRYVLPDDKEVNLLYTPSEKSVPHKDVLNYAFAKAIVQQEGMVLHIVPTKEYCAHLIEISRTFFGLFVNK